jgi:hypothetical protein
MFDFAVLQDAQQLGLQLQRQLTHLVQEERAAIGLLEGALAPGLRSGEGAFLMAEQLALDQRRGQRGAVDRDKGLTGAGRA